VNVFLCHTHKQIPHVLQTKQFIDVFFFKLHLPHRNTCSSRPRTGWKYTNCQTGNSLFFGRLLWGKKFVREHYRRRQHRNSTIMFYFVLKFSIYFYLWIDEALLSGEVANVLRKLFVVFCVNHIVQMVKHQQTLHYN
jgi:hypothetical protein